MYKLTFVLFAVLFVSYVQCSAIDAESPSSVSLRSLCRGLAEAKVKIQEAKKKYEEQSESLKVNGKKVAEKVKGSASQFADEIMDALKVILECAKEQLFPIGDISDAIMAQLQDLLQNKKSVHKEAASST